MRNHLFIGLGGQGGKSIAELRKVFAQRESDAKSLAERGVKWDFLYIDSSRDVTNNRTNWTHFGKSLKLNPDSFLYLKEGGEGLNPDSLSLRPDVAPWIGGENGMLKKFLEGVQGIQGANQRRRFGRLLFANNADRIRKAICDDKIAPMLRNGNQCAIHIFASLAGGTGSGSIMDLVTLLRTRYPSASVNEGFPIFLYLYVTSDDFEEAQVGYFHQNQFAALRDLNALACGRLKPNLLGSDHNGRPFQDDEPITQIVLSTSCNSRNQRITLPQQHKIIAESAFERVFSYASGHLNEDQQRPLTGEDRLAAFPGEPIKNLQRSFRFGSLGMGRWEVPTEEVRELLTQELYVSCYRRLLYQNWDRTGGFLAERVLHTASGATELGDQLLRIIDAHLIEKTTFPDLAQKVTDDLGRAHAGMKNDRYRDIDLEEYEIRLRTRYQKEVDGSGVEALFTAISEKRQSRLAEVVKAMENPINLSWTKSDRPIGLAYVADALDYLQENLRKRMTGIITLDKDPADEALKARMEARKFEWAKMTFLSRTVKATALADAHRQNLMDLLKSDLRRRARTEDHQLLDQIVSTLGKLAGSYRQATSKLQEWAKKAADQRDSLQQDIISLNGTDASNRYELSAEALENYLKTQRGEEAFVRSASEELMSSAILPLVNSRGADAIGKMSTEQEAEFREGADERIYERAKQIHDSIVQRDQIKPVLNGDLMDILRKRSQDNPDAFAEELRRFIDSASYLTQVDTGQIQPKVLRGDSNMPSMPRKAMVIGLPRGHAFAQELKSLISPLMSAGDNTVRGFYEHDDPTQIRMLSVASFMAARFSTAVAELDKIYTRAVATNVGNDTAYFANIDPAGEAGKRPTLLLPSPEESRSALRAALWLGTQTSLADGAEKVVQSSSDRVVLIRQTKEGLQPLLLGTSLEEVSRNADIQLIYRVLDEVGDAVAGLSHQQRSSLRETVDQEDKSIRSGHGVASNEYATWATDRDKIYQLLER